MNLLVTGAAGFICSHYVLRHTERAPEDAIVVLDSLTYAADKSLLDSAADRITFVKGDIANQKLVEKLVKKHNVHAIVNFAAETHVDRSIKDVTPFIHTNIGGVQSLIEVCRKRPDVLLLHVSTDEVYGDLADSDPAFKPRSPLNPSNPYSASKASGDLLLLAAARTHGIRVRITRCTNNYGPHQDRSKLLPVIITRAMKGEKIPIYGKGKQKRDWLYVTDHTDAIEAVLEKGRDGEIYLISAGEEQENINVAHTVLDAMGKSHDLIQFVPDRPGHDWRYSLDSSSVRALGWKPTVSFAEGVRRTIEWYSEK